MRQRLEGQIESLESILGYVVDSYPQVCVEAIKHLRLEDAEASLSSSSQVFGGAFSTPSPSSSTLASSGNIYPHYSKMNARELWRLSTFAKAIAPSLGLNLGIDDDDDESQGYDGLRARIEEARRARARLRSGINIDSPVMPSMQQAAAPSQQPQLAHYPLLPHAHTQPHPPPPSHLPHQHQRYPSKKIQGRPLAAMAHHAEGGFGHTSEGPLQHHHHQLHHPDHPATMQQPQHRMENAQFTSAPLLPHLDSFAPAPHPSSTFDGEADALAYALGLPSQGVYSTGHQPWLATGPHASEQGGNAYQVHSLGQQQSASSGHGDPSHPTPGLNFFSDDYELDLNDQQSNTHQMSILYQLGLQGTVDMATPATSANVGTGDASQSVATPAPIADGSSSHHTPTQWLQPIRGIN